MSRMAAGDFSVSMDDLPEGYSKLSDDFNAMAAQMRYILGAVANSAESTHTGSSEISYAADDLARRTEQQAAALQKTSRSEERSVGKECVSTCISRRWPQTEKKKKHKKRTDQ